MKKLSQAFIFCAVVALAAQAQATLFFGDAFNYPDGELTINDGTGDNVSGGRWTPHSGETFDDNIDVINKQAELLASGSEDANRLAGETMGADERWYYGARFTVNDQRADPNAESINNDYFIHFKDNTPFGFRGRVWLDDPNVADLNTYSLAISATSGGDGQTNWGSDLEFGKEYILLASYEFNTGSADLWINPVDMSSTSVNHTSGGAAFTAIESLALRQDFLGGDPNNQVLIDAVAMGNEWIEVYNAVVPEPSSIAIALTGLAGIACMIRRKRIA